MFLLSMTSGQHFNLSFNFKIGCGLIIIFFILWQSTDLTFASQILHNFCLSRFQGPLTSTWGGALICGENLAGSSLKTILLNTQLYHLFVVSGSHLVLMSAALSKLRAPQLLTKIILAAYSLMTGLQAPVVRALMAFYGGRKSFLFKIWLSFALTLILFPHWWNSYSFHLSFVTAVVWSGTRKYKILWIYVMILPLIANWGVANPFSLILSSIFGLFLELVAIPLLIAVFIFPWLKTLAEASIGILQFAIEQWSQLLGPTQTIGKGLPAQFLIIYSGGIGLLFSLKTIFENRKLWKYPLD